MNKRVAIVTAAGSGMGAACARRLATGGFKVAILSSSGKGEGIAKELGGIGVTGSNQSSDDQKPMKRKDVAAIRLSKLPLRQDMRRSFRSRFEWTCDRAADD